MQRALTILAITVIVTGCTQAAPVSVVANQNENTNTNVNATAAPVNAPVINTNTPVSSPEAVEQVASTTATITVLEEAETEPAESPPEQKSPSATAVKEEKEHKNVTVPLQIVSPEGVARYSVTVEVGSTVEALMEKAKKQGLAYATKGYTGIGTYVTTINGLKEDRRAGFYWIYYLNGSRATAGITIQTVKKGDEIKWNYEKEF